MNSFKVVLCILSVGVFSLLGCQNLNNLSGGSENDATRLSQKLAAQWEQGNPEGMLSCYEEDAIELFPQNWAAWVGHEQILSRYSMVFAEGSVALNSKFEETVGGYTDLGDGFFVCDGLVQTISSSGDPIWQGQTASVARMTEAGPRLVQFMAHRPLLEDTNLLPPNPEGANTVLKALQAIELEDKALTDHFNRLREAWQNHDAAAITAEFCSEGRLVTDGTVAPVRGLKDIRNHYDKFLEEIGDQSAFKNGGSLEFIPTGYHVINDRHVRAYGAWVVRNADGDPVAVGGFGNVYRRDGDRLQLLLSAGGAFPFPTVEEWEEMQAAAAASQEG